MGRPLIKIGSKMAPITIQTKVLEAAFYQLELDVQQVFDTEHNEMIREINQSLTKILQATINKTENLQQVVRIAISEVKRELTKEDKYDFDLTNKRSKPTSMKNEMLRVTKNSDRLKRLRNSNDAKVEFLSDVEEAYKLPSTTKKGNVSISEEESHIVLKQEPVIDHVTDSFEANENPENLSIMQNEYVTYANDDQFENLDGGKVENNISDDKTIVVGSLGKTMACDECSYIAKNKRMLKNHKSVSHTLGDEHRCEDCGLAFTQKYSLITHVNTVHRQAQRFECKECGYEFNKKSNLDRHMKRKHQM